MKYIIPLPKSSPTGPAQLLKYMLNWPTRVNPLDKNRYKVNFCYRILMHDFQSER